MAIDLNIKNFVPAKHKVSPKGWLTYNAPCCSHNGERADKRGRGGMIISPDGSWTAHCFNCGFAVRYVFGEILSYKARRYLNWLGVDENVIQLMVIESLKNRNVESIMRDRAENEDKNKPEVKVFEERDLPDGAQLVTDRSDEKYIDYILNDRGLPLNSYPYMETPNAPGRAKNSIIIPFTHNGKIVGNTRRFLDKKIPKYVSDQQSDYVFGVDMQQENWEYVIVVEGPFDAISVNGVALLNNEISAEQAELIESLNKEIIVVPDRNAPGLKIIDRTVELGWSVSLPDWDDDIIDVNDAVKRYGKLYTLATILDARQTHKIKIEIIRRKLLKKINKNTKNATD